MVKNARLRTPTAHVYLHYSDDSAQNLGKVAINPPKLPEKPEGWTRFVCISDTHSKSFPVPNGDVLLHSGDLTNTGTTVDFEKTMGWLKGLPHKHKMYVTHRTVGIHLTPALLVESLRETTILLWRAIGMIRIGMIGIT